MRHAADREPRGADLQRKAEFLLERAMWKPQTNSGCAYGPDFKQRTTAPKGRPCRRKSVQGEEFRITGSWTATQMQIEFDLRPILVR
jgi:hypothetical protein